MARLPRYILPGHPQHIIQRGNNRGNIFCTESDYLYYLKLLKESSEEHRCAIHAYVLMTNHVHLFKERLSNQQLRDIRFATNSSWILGTEKFSKKIEKIVNRRLGPLQKGGDHKSEIFRKNNNKDVL